MKKRNFISRRSFVSLVIGGLATLAGAEIITLIARYLSPNTDKALRGGVFSAGPIDNFAPDSVTEFPQNGFFLVRTEDGGFLAIYRRCPHLGCTVIWEEEKDTFKCPCHASTFDFYGDFTRTLVPRALDTFPVSFENNNVLVQLGQPTHRQHYSPDQLAFPDESI